MDLFTLDCYRITEKKYLNLHIISVLHDWANKRTYHSLFKNTTLDPHFDHQNFAEAPVISRRGWAPLESKARGIRAPMLYHTPRFTPLRDFSTTQHFTDLLLYHPAVTLLTFLNIILLYGAP